MAKYIKRKTLVTLIENLDWYSDEFGKLNQGATCEDKAYLRYNDVMDAIKQVATVKQKHGKWIKEPDRHFHWHCDRCGYVVGVSGLDCKYCPNCGAKMDGGDGDE